MADLGILALGTFTNGNDTAIQGSDPVLEVIGSTDDADYVYTTLNATSSAIARFALGNVPSDFGDMDTLSIQLRYAWATGTQVNTWSTLAARVWDSTGTIPYTNERTVASGITTTTPTNSVVAGFTLTAEGLAATKAEWDAAIVYIYFYITKSMAGDTLQKRVYAAEITGTYSTGASPISGTASQSFSNSGTLTGGGALAGSTAQVFGELAALTGDGALAGAAAQTFSNTGSLTTLPTEISGVASLSFTNNATLVGSGTLAGTAAQAFANTAALVGNGALAGIASPTFGQAAILTGLGALVGTAAQAFSNSASLGEAGSGAIAGVAGQAFTGSAVLVGSGALAGVASQVFAPAGLLSGAGALGGVAAQSFAGAGALGDVPSGAIAGVASVTFTASATLIAFEPVVEAPFRAGAKRHWGGVDHATARIFEVDDEHRRVLEHYEEIERLRKPKHLEKKPLAKAVEPVKPQAAKGMPAAALAPAPVIEVRFEAIAEPTAAQKAAHLQRMKNRRQAEQAMRVIAQLVIEEELI